MAALSRLRTEGPLALARKAAAEGLRRSLFLAANLADLPVQPPKTELSLRPLAADDVPIYLASAPDLDHAETLRHLAAGHACTLVVADGQVLASTWVARDAIDSRWLGLRRPLQPDEAYIFAAHTAVAARGRGLNRILNQYLAEQLRGEGVRRMYRMVMPGNAPARAAHRAAGFVEEGQYVSFGLGTRRRCVFVPLELYAHLRR